MSSDATSSAPASGAGVGAGAGAGTGAADAPFQGKSPLLEYSVVYTDRAANLMASTFREAMRDISTSLTRAYNAKQAVLIPGSGTYGMEAAAWAFGVDRKAVIIRNGYFSYRWSHINATARIFSEEVVIKARPASGADEGSKTRQFAPAPIDEVVAKIKAERPAVVFAPHVETSTGILLPDTYVAAVAAAAHEVDAVFVLDGIAAGTLWVDMEALGVDAYITAPQKGWSGPACVGIVMLGERGLAAVEASDGKRCSFTCNLPRWLDVMRKYDSGAFMYYTTLPTDALLTFRDVIKELEAFGTDKAKQAMMKLGSTVRAQLAERGFKSTAADGFAAPGVVVVFSSESGMVGQFKTQGIQVAGGVPWKLDEDAKYGMDSRASTFRVGLFGLDKLRHVDYTVATLMKAIDKILAAGRAAL